MAKRKKDAGYRAAILGAKGVIRILIYILIAIGIIYLAGSAYTFGYAVFNQKPISAEPGQAVTVIVPDGASAHDIGKILEQKGLIESALIFTAQEKLSGYKDALLPGTYILNTAMTADEMMAILAQENTEGQVQVTPQEKKVDENAIYDKVEQDDSVKADAEQAAQETDIPAEGTQE
ncbi:MAG: endolytic transglycosylase MltG [Lachnospiraceae bacterium]|nr:endolytic transglycosylase MltG [Lachnospiraceae bacterium]